MSCKPPPSGSFGELTMELVFGSLQPVLGSLKLLLGLFDVRRAAAKPLDADAGGKRSRDQHRSRPPPRHGSTDLQCDTHQPRVEGHRAFALRQLESSLAPGSIACEQTGHQSDDRDQQEEGGHRERRDQGPEALAQPDERTHQNEDECDNAEYDPQQRRDQNAGAEAGPNLRLKPQESRHSTHDGPLARPQGAESEAEADGQRQRRIRPVLQRPVDRGCHVVADLGDRLDRFLPLFAHVGDDASCGAADICA